MEVRHMPPRKPQMKQSTCLGWCFLATMAIMAILVFVTYALGQALSPEHVFPFKTWAQLVTGTPAWAQEGEVEERYCAGTTTLVAKVHFKSGAGSIWIVYTDRKLFSSAYFLPGSEKPVAVAMGRIQGGQVIVELNVPYDPALHRPCDPWTKKSASGGSDGC